MEEEVSCLSTNPEPTAADLQSTVPAYLIRHYWWAYVHPSAVRVFERQWVVNLILWGNFRRLRDAAIDLLGNPIRRRSLQVACVYGDLTLRLLARHAADASLEVVDALPAQLENLSRKLGPDASRVALCLGDATELSGPAAGYDQVLVLFLLHEQPEDVRRCTPACRFCGVAVRTPSCSVNKTAESVKRGLSDAASISMSCRVGHSPGLVGRRRGGVKRR